MSTVRMVLLDVNLYKYVTWTVLVTRTYLLFLHRSAGTKQIMAEEVAAAGAKKRLEGKVAIITGGTGGIGEATSRLFAEHGAKVIVADIAEESVGKKLCEDIGVDLATYVYCDVSKEEHVSAAVDVAVRMHGQLDIMFNNAGIADRRQVKSVVDYDVEEFDRVMSVNARGVMLGIKHAARVMIPRKKGSIISTASVGGLLGGITSYAYTASKHAVIGLTRNGAADLGKHGVRVNCVSPNAIATAITVQYVADAGGSFTEEDRLNVENFCDRVANLKGPTLKPLDVAEAALYLASDEAKCVSGHNLVVDGGMTVVNHVWGLYR